MTGHSRVFAGIDVGGTFTDLVLFDPEDGTLRTVKVPSSPPDFWPSVVDAMEAAGIGKSRPVTILHGTTVHLNAFLERKGTKTALITTRGFRDVYEMRRGNRSRPYDMHFRYPEPLVPRRFIYEVAERTSANGEIAQTPDLEALPAIAERIMAAGLQSVAICFLHSYRNPENERAVEEAMRDLLPEAFVSASYQTCREWREYERTSTAIINAYVSPVLKRYLASLEKALEPWEDVDLFLLQSNGGLISAREAADKGVLTLLSGPVGGNVAGRALAAEGNENLICIDMGGTSFEASLVVGGESVVRTEREVGGFPIMTPMVDIHTVGAGGGSIGWEDGGALRVGPHSAGARPGPAAYGAGGKDATVTDANLVLGRICADGVLGSGLTLHRDLAGAAVDTLGAHFDLDVESAAQGILDVINEQMANAIRTITVRRGIDPRDFALVAYGGAGPMHAVEIARLLGMSKVIVPRSAGAFSAWGMLRSDLIHDSAETYLKPLRSVDWEVLERRYAPMEETLRRRLLGEGANPQQITLTRSLDIRYVGQEYAITVPLDDALFRNGSVRAEAYERVRAAFDAEYLDVYGHSNPEEDAEVATIRVRATGRTSIDHEVFATAAPVEDDRGSRERTQPAIVNGAAMDVRFIARSNMSPGVTEPGPAVVEEATCTTFVPPDFTAAIDASGHLILTPREAE